MANKQPYQRTNFWKENQFWNNENSLYSKESCEKLDKWANSLYKLKQKQEFTSRVN